MLLLLTFHYLENQDQEVMQCSTVPKPFLANSCGDLKEAAHQDSGCLEKGFCLRGQSSKCSCRQKETTDTHRAGSMATKLLAPSQVLAFILGANRGRDPGIRDALPESPGQDHSSVTCSCLLQVVALAAYPRENEAQTHLVSCLLSELPYFLCETPDEVVAVNHG